MAHSRSGACDARAGAVLAGPAHPPLRGRARDATFPLLQHRAALFLAVLVICLWAAADPGARRVAVAVTAISMLSFLAIYWLAGAPPSLKTIAVADLVALPALAFAAYGVVRGG